MVPVHGHAVAMWSDAAADGYISITAVFRKTFLGSCALHSNAELPVVELVKQDLGERCL
jgi:hypothetical protein